MNLTILTKNQIIEKLDFGSSESTINLSLRMFDDYFTSDSEFSNKVIEILKDI